MTKHKVLIVGDHPIVADLNRQYQALGYEITLCPNVHKLDVDVNDYQELFLLPATCENDVLASDNYSIALLGSLADRIENNRHKLRCHLLVQSQKTLQMLQLTDFCEAITKRIDVYPFTMEDVWSRCIELDREPITLQSEKHVHLVIFGMSEMGEMVAINAAHRAHFPNYVRNHVLRTRITVIDERATELQEQWMARYPHLFENSYYRTIKPSATRPVMAFHKPQYESVREDFVDIEWEFVEAMSHDADLTEKLHLWAADELQLLTVVVAHDDGKQNISEALHLPDILFNKDIPIYIFTREDITLSHYSNFHPFGMLERGYDVTLPLVRMAKNINYVYDRCYAENFEQWDGRMRYSVEIDADERERSWDRLKNVKRMSNICHAMTIAPKMRSIGLSTDDWDKFYDISQQDLELLAQVEHNRWSVEELIMGWRPCTPEEQADIEADIQKKGSYKKRKIHYDLRAYNDLRDDQTGKSAKIYDLCISASLPLIAKAFIHEEGGES